MFSVAVAGLTAFGLLGTGVSMKMQGSETVKNANLEFRVDSQSGLQVRMGGVPIIRGSWFQYYAPGWTKGYYSSRWNPQKITKVNPNTVRMTFTTSNKLVEGEALFTLQEDTLQVDYKFGWNGGEPAKVEVTPGMLWLSPWQDGTIVLDGQVANLSAAAPEGKAGDTERMIGPDSKRIQFGGLIGDLDVTSNALVRTFDARGYSQDWAEDNPILWQGATGLDVAKGKPAEFKVTYKFTNRLPQGEDIQRVTREFEQVPQAVLPDESKPILIPKPTSAELNWDNTFEITGGWNYPAGRPKYFDLFKDRLEERFMPVNFDPKKGRVKFSGGMADLKKKEGSYRIRIEKDEVEVLGQGEEGLMNAMYRLSSLAFTSNGRLLLPTGTLEDEPKTTFRGVHLFIGPTAKAFHNRLWSRVLRPLMLNKVVLQCERATWDAIAGTETPITMKKSDLVQLVNQYREMTVEPIPLIQSFGHMEWFFANGKNLDLAFNPEVPYTIDPRKPRTKEVLHKLWDEIVKTMQPNTLHFGCDEVDMRGFPDDPKLTTDLWVKMMPILGDIAKKHKSELMIWGDKGLAPGEAIDAAHGDDKEQAALRRAAIPKGAYIADWHYKAEQEPKGFLKSLQTWKNDNLKPIASTWYRPENVRGFFLAAELEGAGVLQTTWAGYESSEANMLRELKQFSAMVLAADYGWSARQERLEKLPYNADEVFAKMYAGKPSPLNPMRGFSMQGAESFEVGGVQFRGGVPLALRGIDRAGLRRPTEIELPVTGRANEIAFAVSTNVRCDFTEPIAALEIVQPDGTVVKELLKYGLHVRSKDDAGTTFFGPRKDGISVVRVSLPKRAFKSIRLVSENAYAGFQVHGITFF